MSQAWVKIHGISSRLIRRCYSLVSYMALIQFTRNHTDHSTDRGYQFEFFCDRCGNGFMTQFQPSAVGMAGSALRTVGSLFGGFLGSVGSNSYEIERAIQGPATIMRSGMPWTRPNLISGNAHAVRIGFARRPVGTMRVSCATHARRIFRQNSHLRRCRRPSIRCMKSCAKRLSQKAWT